MQQATLLCPARVRYGSAFAGPARRRHWGMTARVRALAGPQSRHCVPASDPPSMAELASAPSRRHASTVACVDDWAKPGHASCLIRLKLHRKLLGTNFEHLGISESPQPRSVTAGPAVAKKMEIIWKFLRLFDFSAWTPSDNLLLRT